MSTAAATDRLLVYIPGGLFTMGDESFAPAPEGYEDEQPRHQPWLTGFYLENLEVTAGLWNEVRAWGLTHGYTGLPACTNAADLPAGGVTWYDSVAWCNARSEREALVPVYYTDAPSGAVYRAGSLDLSAAQVDWAASGYRLPTEAEWERAAKSGRAGRIYPWTLQLGYYLELIDATHARYATDSPVAVGAYTDNDYELHDMAGNQAEWCWDWYDAAYYQDYATNGWPADPRGPAAPATHGGRVIRGGSWGDTAWEVRCSARDPAAPSAADPLLGLRCARSLSGNENCDRDGDRLADWWEFTYYGNPTSALPLPDEDGDGRANWQEELAGTDPTNAASQWWMSSRTLPAAAPRPVITWPSQGGRVYAIWRGTNFNNGLLEQCLASGLPATPPLNAYTDAPPAMPGTWYYRVQAARP